MARILFTYQAPFYHQVFTFIATQFAQYGTVLCSLPPVNPLKPLNHLRISCNEEVSLDPFTNTHGSVCTLLECSHITALTQLEYKFFLLLSVLD